METFALLAAAAAAVTAFLIGVSKIASQLAAFVRRQGRLDLLLRRELTDNGHDGLKSRIIKQGERQAEQGSRLEQTQGNVADVQDALDEHLEDFDRHNRAPHAHDKKTP